MKKNKVARDVLFDRVQLTSDYLSALLKKPNFYLRFEVKPAPDILSDYVSQWKGNTSEDSSNWGHYFDEIGGISSKFIVAAYDGKTLTGLCLMDTLNPCTPRHSITIQTIEGMEVHNPLKGLITGIFCQVALSLAGRSGDNYLSVINPVNQTRDGYKRALPFSEHGKHLVYEISQQFIQWNCIFMHQRTKGKYTP